MDDHCNTGQHKQCHPRSQQGREPPGTWPPAPWSKSKPPAGRSLSAWREGGHTGWVQRVKSQEENYKHKKNQMNTIQLKKMKETMNKILRKLFSPFSPHRSPHYTSRTYIFHFNRLENQTLFLKFAMVLSRRGKETWNGVIHNFKK